VFQKLSLNAMSGPRKHAYVCAGVVPVDVEELVAHVEAPLVRMRMTGPIECVTRIISTL
jgi:hypothetical protein